MEWQKTQCLNIEQKYIANPLPPLPITAAIAAEHSMQYYFLCLIITMIRDNNQSVERERETENHCVWTATYANANNMKFPNQRQIANCNSVLPLFLHYSPIYMRILDVFCTYNFIIFRKHEHISQILF